MVALAQERGLDAECKALASVDETFDAAVAVFDVLNFIPSAELNAFMASVADVLNPGGIFSTPCTVLPMWQRG